MKPRQLSLIPSPNLFYGGKHIQGKRKTFRPIDPKRPMHLVIRATQARGKWSLLHPANERLVKSAIKKFSEENQVRIYQYANVGNHIHFLLQPKTRKGFQKFLRKLTGMIAMAITGAKKGRKLAQRFWDLLAFTRVVDLGKGFRRGEKYIIKNLFEADGLKFDSKTMKIYDLSRETPPPG